VRGSVQQCGSAAVCGSVRQCVTVRQCDSVYGSAACAAVRAQCAALDPGLQGMSLPLQPSLSRPPAALDPGLQGMSLPLQPSLSRPPAALDPGLQGMSLPLQPSLSRPPAALDPGLQGMASKVWLQDTAFKVCFRKHFNLPLSDLVILVASLYLRSMRPVRAIKERNCLHRRSEARE
jgi:hypothetical protein